MFAERKSVTIATDENGDGTGYIEVPHGAIHSIQYTKVDYADGVDFAITLEATGESLWTDTNVNASEKVYPLVAANLGADGAASSLTEVPIVAANDRIKIVVGSGGDTKSGTFTVIIT
jgi:hypothetical protein